MFLNLLLAHGFTGPLITSASNLIYYWDESVTETKQKTVLNLDVPRPKKEMEHAVRLDRRSPEYQAEVDQSARFQKTLRASVSASLHSLRETYIACWEQLLWLEEATRANRARYNDLKQPTFTVHGRNKVFVSLDLKFDRKRVWPGAQLMVFSQSDAKGDVFVCGVSHIAEQSNGVGVTLHAPRDMVDLIQSRPEFPRARFLPSRTPFKLQHFAIRNALRKPPSSYRRFIFPQSEGEITAFPPSTVSTDTHLNANQLDAVQNGLTRPERTPPLIVFGPPGTGKTTTLATLALKLAERRSPKQRTLLVAASNAAVDELLLRVMKLGIPSTDLLRVYGFSTPVNEDSPIFDCSRYSHEEGHYLLPTADDVRRAKIVATTCAMAQKLALVRNQDSLEKVLAEPMFSHVLLDEAGAVTEPETLCGFVGLLKTSGTLVLVSVMCEEISVSGCVTARCSVLICLFKILGVQAGDHMQLGPIVSSKSTAMAKSLMQRLCTDDGSPYRAKDDGSYDPRYVHMLTKNYRSHPAILKLSSELFYHGKLEPMVRPSSIPIEGIQENFPVIFHGVKGEELREGASPSYFNIQEAQVVANYIASLLGAGVPAEEIGVVSPYNKQSEKIKLLLQERGLDDPLLVVGSVELFQGQERQAILVTTSRTRKVNAQQSEEEFDMGFLSDPRRFNVSITRAKAFLCVVGDPDVLWSDEHWRRFIEMCEQNNSYQGARRT